ncbi:MULTISPECIES: glycoside hydrolase family 18 protein [Silvimonas]|uniref:glycoside hydrolase family 18 protein n=1 Tax=Silvimonas TaxID=300264 RepID=UPI0024B3C36F|nr:MULTISPECIES: glycoside hydrolase family 18 protein [Silvimonas]MDR3428608.1 glycoside hydrolase family 18 protein [Silvimonas sp.]
MKRLLLLPFFVAAALAHADTVVFQDDFKGDLSQWVGQNGDGTVPMHGVIVDDPLRPGQKALKFTKKVFGGDMFSKVQFAEGKKYTLSFDYLGLCSSNCGGVVGYTADFPGRDNWLAGAAKLGGGADKLKDNKQWNTYNLDFKGKFPFHLALEHWTNGDGDAGDSLFANFKLVEKGDGGGDAKAPAAAAVVAGGVAAPTSPQFVAYYPAWAPTKSGYYVKNLETSGAASQATVINYAFANVVDNKCVVGDPDADYKTVIDAAHTLDGKVDAGTNGLFGNWNQLKQLKQKHPNLKVVISLGGWTWSKNFSDAALPKNREAFVKSCVDTFIKGNIAGKDGLAAGVFDGIDIDWEYPGSAGNEGNVVRDEDPKNYTALLAEFRKQLDALKPGYLLTVAASASSSVYGSIESDKIQQSLNWINLMTYDFAGPWDSTTGYQSNLFTGPKDRLSIDMAVKDYIEKGVQPAKLVLGVPFYGYGWVTGSMDNHGIHQAVKAKAKGTPDEGVATYAEVKAKAGDVFRDDKTKAIVKVSGNEAWVYDDPQVLKDKIDYVKKMKLGGMMAWEISQDTPDGELSGTIYNGLIKH